jgi:hypothetical protein
MYVFHVVKYLEFAHSNMPSDEDFLRFRELLLEKAVSRSTLNYFGILIPLGCGNDQMLYTPTTNLENRDILIPKLNSL